MPQSIRNRRPAASSNLQLPVTSWFAPRNVIFIPKHLRLFRPTSPAVWRFPRKCPGPFHRPPQRIICFGNCRPAIKSRTFLFCAFSIAYFKGTRRTNRRDFCGQSAERSKKFLYNLDKLPHSVINLDLYDVRSYFMSLK